MEMVGRRRGDENVTTPAVDPLALVYHELRSPLGLMVTAARSAADEASDVEVRRRCETIVRAAERMLRTASQVFEVSRAQKAVGRREYSPFALVDDLVTDMAGLDARLRLLVNEGADKVTVFGVAEQFEALVHCLLSNAIDHCERGSTILVGVSLRDGGLEVTITNRVGGDRHRGLGLGNYLAEQLASALGATITVSTDADLYAVAIRLASAL